MNTDIAALQTIVDVLQDNDCVTDVVPVVEGTTIIGYTLRFLHHDPITIYHGEKGEKGDKGDKGDEGLTPTIGIRQDTDGASWERLGKATGETGTTGESFFRDVTQDAENVYLIPSDGTTVTVPKGTSLNISFAESDLTACLSTLPVNFITQ